ncbi:MULTISPECIES: hypothetical protein [Haloferax]|uniref:Membrane protein 6-pyruvoyl-tetrahydropterin synthase-related domain-containing protein n=2 Tax=Haloferax TaxID=2251 RepID=A0A6G1Z694_9EURY|nr:MULTISPECIES: hypothetical protein [Haloferax]KAB1185430.1 hypothetical protein Hfx1149_15360 [Haloferax sp. CBA1149]MRW82076.1 hypothetical protein [Haloferax marinisediminis]
MTRRVDNLLERPRVGQRLAHVLCFLGFLTVYAYLLRGITIGQLYTFGDFPPFYGMGGIEKFTTVWVDQGLGFSYIYHVLPLYLGAVTLVGGVLAQNLLFLSFLPMGYLAFVLFGRRFIESIPVRHLAAFVYAINPLTIGEFVNGGMAALIGYAALPLLLHYLYAIVDTDGWEETLKTGAVFGATTVSPWLGFWMVAPFAGYLVYRARDAPRTILKLCASGVLGVVLSLPSVHHMLQRALGFDGGQSVLSSTLTWNYAEATVFTVARLAGNHGVMAMNKLGYNTDPAMLIGLVIPGIALLAIRQRRFHVYYGIAGAIIAFIVLTKHGYTTVLFELFPPVWSLRNPVKLQYPLLVCLSILFGAGLETVLAGPNGSVVWWDSQSSQSSHALTDGGTTVQSNVLVVAVVVLALLSYAAPASGALGLEEVRGDGYYVPQEHAELTDELDGTILWAPYGYTTQLRLRHTAPDHLGIKSGGVLHGIQNTEYVSSLFHDFAEDPETVHEQLASQGVNYVVVESDPPGDITHGPPRVVERWGAPWLWGSPESYNTALNESSGYDYAFTAGEYTVYRVEGATDHERFEQSNGIHQVYYPERPDYTDTDGPNLVANGEFDDGLEGWWAWDGSNGTQTTVVDTADGHAVEMVTESGDIYPIAQEAVVSPGQPYQLTLDAEGSGNVYLYWYNGTRSPENLVERESYALNASPQTVVSQGSTLSIRIRPNESRVQIERVSLQETTYPRRTGFTANTDEVPGVVIDGRETNETVGVAVGVNLNQTEAELVDPAVSIRDAETVLDGELVYDDSYRQGAGVLLPDDEVPESVPAEARVVTFDHPNGTVLDYWVVGEFDDRPVTVLYTSYDERWEGPTDSTHFEAYGWANGYIDATPSEIRWTGGTVRRWVVNVWAGSWALTLGALGIINVRKRRQQSQSDEQSRL